MDIGVWASTWTERRQADIQKDKLKSRNWKADKGTQTDKSKVVGNLRHTTGFWGSMQVGLARSR